MLCYCHSEKPVEKCCQAFLLGESFPSTPEQLMRSRYSAYATSNINYIYATYSPESRKLQNIEDISEWAKQCRWVNLKIHHAPTADNNNGIVEFSAYFIENNKLCVMRERSNFLKIDGHWFYHDGEMVENQIFTKSKRNEPCPCQQPKKYKNCCGRYIK